jgi:hypothetical protein
MRQRRTPRRVLNQHFGDRIEDATASKADPCIHWNLCSGLPAIVIQTPLHYFGAQALVGLLSLIALTVIEGAR